ncbi:hypothetical protein C8C76_101153 [Halanaerobium saccharolyticum]|jgi:hypothetical protein|uniref:Uncharacterized protein n=1 Tax=Halanaerobium saccharolyticum TaxID=43595 RepID=A0A2T5RT59_9FIRM|nr:hypothetical protein [Halanaerobium saccharolyticum]OEG62002.1 MAG: hypothetical protein BHK79_01090 [Halanaerobium sp. MDAL1]PTW03512.1 hypothetical protein C8C76_101153 [Halanaerobium saccharolyticum]
MDKYDYHFISIKFLTAILLALIFAFLLIYVFTPQEREDYPVYKLERQELFFSELSQISASRTTAAEESRLQEKLDFEESLRERSFELMKQSKSRMLAVISANHLEKMNGLREEKMLALEAEQRTLNQREENLLQERRQELEAELSQKLQQLRQEVRNKYSDFNQQEIRANYLRMINLELKIEFVARTESEKEKYRNELEKVRSEQQTLMAEKNSQLNEDISTQTSALIMEFNQQYSAYRDQIRSEHQQLISEQRQEIEAELAAAREEIKGDLASARAEKSTELDDLIEKSKKLYY